MLVTVAFSIHRPEILPLAEPAMRRHQAILLEEPHTPGFEDMLRDALPIEDYLMATDFEYPVFSRMTCELLRDLHRQGRTVLQVEPYMDALASIHEFFASGGTPGEIEPGSLQAAVYKVERLWSGALLDFYRKSVSTPFEEVVEAVKFFGKADAARGRLRDDLRAQAVAELCRNFDSLFVEAGYIHVYLMAALRRRLPEDADLRPLYLLEPIVRELTGQRRAMGPGDILTIRYVYNPEYEGAQADLQAARSLVRIKILHKEEMTDTPASFPHTRDEIAASNLVRALSFEECRDLYGRIRSLPSPEARQTVEEYLARRQKSDNTGTPAVGTAH